MTEYTVTITEDDLTFLKLTKRHYEIFRDRAKKEDDPRIQGIFDKQLFYAERFITRIKEQT